MDRRTQIAAIALAASIGASAAHGAEMQCRITVKFSCAAESCDLISTTVFNRIDMARGAYARCDPSGCEWYQASVTASGQFIGIEVPGRGVAAKIGVGTNSFHEVVSLGHQVYVSFGICR